MVFREAGLHSKMDYACYLAAALMLVLRRPVRFGRPDPVQR